jgi:hypothetical protein
VRAKICLYCVLAGLLAGCATSNPSLYSYRNDINGELTDMIIDNLLPVDGTPGADVWLNASRITQRNGVVMFFLEVHYASASSWLNIEAGNSLTLNIDGQEFRYNGIGSSYARKKNRQSLFTEDAIYQVTAADLRRIANARSVSVTIIGSQGAVRRDFGPANLEKFKSFVSTYLDRTK